MKKFSGTIAMILVMVMLASCFTMNLAGGNPVLLFLTIPLDIITFPVQLIFFMITGGFTSADMETQIYLANAEYNVFTEYYSLRDKMYSLPEAELAALQQNLFSMPETERDASIEKFISLTEEKQISLIRTYNSIPESEIVSSMERINSLTEAERISLLQAFNSLTEAELDSLMEQIKTMYKTEYVAAAHR